MLFISIDSLELPAIKVDPDVGFEIRLDRCPFLDFAQLKQVLAKNAHPILLTLRSLAQGGFFAGSILEKQAIYLKLLALQPQFLDIEIDVDEFFIEKIVSNARNTKIVLSFHDFSLDPLSIDFLYEKWVRSKTFHLKIAKKVHSSTQCIDLLLQKKNYPHLSLICMGDSFSFARVLGFAFGNFLNFACLEAPLAAGQISYLELVDVYKFHTISEKTKIYALIGNPVDHSIGHIFHNDYFFKKKLDCRYVKIPLKEDELTCFFQLAKLGGFQGFSVTMPLKEKVLPFVDEFFSNEKQIQAINTLKIENGKVFATNTDGIGAIQALEKYIKLENRRILILGAGGSAKAISYQAHQKGAQLTFVNRTREKAFHLQKLFTGEILEKLEEGGFFDVIICCLPANIEMAFPLNLKCRVAFDINYHPKMTTFLKHMKILGSTIVFGMEMFENQAVLQQEFWIRS